jgi:hypothetical protein
LIQITDICAAIASLSRGLFPRRSAIAAVLD